MKVNPTFELVQIMGLYVLIQTIHSSQRRWQSVGYALLALAILVAMVVALAILLPAHALPGSTGWTVDTLANGVGWILFLPLILGANKPPRRKTKA